MHQLMRPRGWRAPTALLLLGLLAAACGPTATAPAKPAAAPTTAAAPAAPAASAAPTAAPAAASAPAAAPAAPAAPPPRVALKVAVQGRPDQAHLTLALERGYFTQRGLDIETVQIGSGAEMVPALSTNQIQVGNGAPSVALFNALARGVNIRIVADYAHVGTAEDTTLAILARKDLYDAGTVRSLTDLKGGRTFASGSVPGTVSDMLFFRALEKEGITRDGIDIQHMSFPDILAAFGNQRIEAGTLTEPLATQAVQRGMATWLYPAGAVIPGQYLSVLQYSEQFAQEQPDAGTRFMAAYLQGVRDYYDAFLLKKDRDAAIALLVQHLAVRDPIVWESMGPMFIDLNGRINLDELRAAEQFYVSQGATPVPDLARYVDTRFADAAVQLIGRR